MDRIDIERIQSFFASTGDEIYRIACDTVERESMGKLIESGVLVGLSGGADSVLLLCFLLEYRRRLGLDFTVAASHINHGIRGDEADSDEAFSRMLCESLGVEIFVDRFFVPEVARREGCSIEETARNIRYSRFMDIMSGRNDIGCVAVAHNMSDSVETVIFNILRGSGSRGASGIRPVRDSIIRPLLEISKEQIRSALDSFGFPYVTDSTNLSDDYSRNYIRHEVIPSLRHLSNDPERMIARFARNMRSDDEFIDSVVVRIFDDNCKITNSLLLSLHYSLYVRVLSRMADKSGASISYRIAEDIHNLLYKDNFSYSLIGGVTFVCERGECRVSADSDGKINFCFQINWGVTDLSPFNAVFVISKDKIYSNVYKNSIQANLSSAIINGSLYLRPRKDGDTVYYGGMTHKIKKLFSDAKIPRSKRDLIPILCDDKGVVWVPGFGTRDDGVPTDQREDLYVRLEINTDIPADSRRLFSGSEFRT